MWRHKKWGQRKHLTNNELNQEDYIDRVYEAGADAMHLDDIKYLEEHKVLVKIIGEGKVRVLFDFSTEDWLAFTGKEAVL